MCSTEMEASEMCNGGVDSSATNDQIGEGVDVAEVPSLDICLEEEELYDENGDPCDELGEGQGEAPNITAQDVLAMEFDNPKEASRFYDQYSRGA
ncbi:hypothetical protein PIB30_064627 [Stylosanthes scabra]|uniref:Uncharacterized protein n=1 Tax=Stylosanthes scabra TaxID=79078 RepID=A0ABU6VLB5_9FABA|nr:hypothetical protein [Stylosanthes scabra]